MALQLTQPLKEMIRGIFPGSTGDRRIGLKTLAHSCADFLEIWEPSGPVQACNCLLTVILSTSRILEFGRGISPILHKGKGKWGWF